MSIKDLRSQAGLTQTQFAELLSIPKRTIEDWETGKRTPPKYVSDLIEYKLSQIMKGALKMYKIKELETNVTYDDLYSSLDDACAAIGEYEADDENYDPANGEEPRNVTYVIIDAITGEIIERTKLSKKDLLTRAQAYLEEYYPNRHKDYNAKSFLFDVMQDGEVTQEEIDESVKSRTPIPTRFRLPEKDSAFASMIISYDMPVFDEDGNMDDWDDWKELYYELIK